MLNRSFGYLLNVETNNVVLLKSFSTEFDNITITFTVQNSGLLETEEKFKLTLFINK